MPSQTVRTGRVNALQGSLALKAPVRYTTTGPVNLSGLGLQLYGEWIIDLEEGDRVLVKAQADPVENGVYSADSSNWKRTPDFDGGEDAVAGTLVSVLDGDQGQGFWAVGSPGIPVGRALYMGVHPLTFARIIVGTSASAAGTIDVVDELPASGMLTGDVVFLTTDDKIYRYDGYDWITWVDGEDIVAGSITAGKLAVADLSAITTSTGTLTVGDEGYIRGGQTDYNTGTGFFLGYSGADYKFSIGDPAGEGLTWDGSNLLVNGGGTFSGDLSAAGGTFSGDLSAAGGTFSGDLSAAGGTFSGDLSAAGGTFTGSLSGVDGTFIGTLSAVDGSFGNITAGGVVTLSDTSSINGGQTDYNTGTGFFLGYSGGDYKFSIGDPSGSYVTWDGSSLRVSGATFASMNFEHTAGDYVHTYMYTGTANTSSVYPTFSKFVGSYTATIRFSGYVRVKAELYNSTAGRTVYMQVRKNGSPVSSVSYTGTTPSTKYIDVAVSPGDTIEIYGAVTSGSVGYAVDARMCVGEAPDRIDVA